MKIFYKFQTSLLELPAEVVSGNICNYTNSVAHLGAVESNLYKGHSADV